MEIGVEEQQYTDFDWFCVDEIGQIGHFTTAGFKRLPLSVSRSAEDLRVVAEYFTNVTPILHQHEIDPSLAEHIPYPKERYLRSFVAMADRGLFSFDIATYLKPDINYFRVAIPRKSLHIDELPNVIRSIVRRTILKGRLLHSSSRIPYQDTLQM